MTIEIVEQEKEKSVAVVEKPSQIDSMIELAITKGVAVDNLEKLISLKYEHERRENEKAFHESFAKMQGELPAIKKTHPVLLKSGEIAYRYAALEDIVDQIKPFLTKYGFSYSWSETLTDREKFKRVTCKIFGHGHSESAFFDVPVLPASQLANDAQQNGASSTYAKRYSLIGILGITCDEDLDAVIAGEKEERENLIKEAQDLYSKYPKEKKSQSLDEWIDRVNDYSTKAIRNAVDKMRGVK